MKCVSGDQAASTRQAMPSCPCRDGEGRVMAGEEAGLWNRVGTRAKEAVLRRQKMANRRASARKKPACQCHRWAERCQRSSVDESEPDRPPPSAEGSPRSMISSASRPWASRWTVAAASLVRASTKQNTLPLPSSSQYFGYLTPYLSWV